MSALESQYELDRAMGEFAWTLEARDIRGRVQQRIDLVATDVAKYRNRRFPPNLDSAARQTLFRTELTSGIEGPLRLTMVAGHSTGLYHHLLDEFVQTVIKGYTYRGSIMTRGDKERGVVVWGNSGLNFVRSYSPDKVVVTVENPLKCSSPFERNW